MPVPAPAAVVGAATARPMPAGRRALWGFVVSWHNDPLGTYWPLYAGPNYVGRAGAADGLHIEVADPATSSTHGTVHCDPSTGRVLVEDTGSTNGTFVNEERLPYQGARELRDGDRLRFGSYTVRLLLVPRP
jgi:pSer/pThr/pTyr-binding forkhead associated (FHA) protein